MLTENKARQFLIKRALPVLIVALFIATPAATALYAAPTTATGPTIAIASVDELSPEEAAGLIFMREEEKLAHDVYVTLGTMWQLPIFSNIAQSEQRHTDAVRTVLTAYHLADPAVGNAVGVFTDPTLQALYTQLVAQGSQSLTAALTVGATIEDLDIVDLQSRLGQSDHVALQRLYETLLQGSSNHLRAFTSLLLQQGSDAYTPQYLDQESYDAIINAEHGGRSSNRGSRRGR